MSEHNSAGRFHIEPVAAADWVSALRLLFARFPEAEIEPRIAETLRSIDAGRLSLDGLRWALESDQPVGAALFMEQPDGICLVWPPIVTCGAADPEAVERALLECLTKDIDAGASRLAQILFDPREIADESAYVAAGFRHSTDLFFLARSLQEALPTPSRGDLQALTYADALQARFAAVIEASYVDSADCPHLAGLRSGVEALASHRLSGCWDPRLWLLYRQGDQDVAVLLLNDHPEQDAVELVYFGVVPSARGQGHGRRLIADALAQAAARSRAVMFLAVDTQNAYANSLYEEAGFVEIARRRALFRFPRGMARE